MKKVVKKAIEVGNTFLLGDKYSRSLDLKYLDQDNKEKYPVMGCYGIGIERVMASYVEQNNDEKGMIWSLNLAPYQVAIVLLNKDAESYANELHDLLEEKGISVILDDRDERAGVKFNDMDLIGIPIRITIGKGYTNEKVWLNANQMAELFDRDVKTIRKHINNAITEELSGDVVVAKFASTTIHGAIANKTQTHMVDFYNLDVILSVGYRVKSKNGILFRRWANSVLKDYLIKGYSINKKRLEQLEKTIKLLDITNRAYERLNGNDAKEIIKVIDKYSYCFDFINCRI